MTMTIAEVSRELDLSADTLRYYERIGLIPPVNRRESGVRDYTEEDFRWAEFAKCMRGAGLSIESLIEYVALVQQGAGTEQARKDILIEERDALVARMAEMQKTLERLNYKIARYESIMLEAEKGLQGE